MKRTSNRRQFLGASAALAATVSVGKLYAAGSDSSPNETINIGVIGCGARAGQVVKGFKDLPGNRIMAFCDVNSTRREKFRNQFGESSAPLIHDYRKLIERSDVDAVLVASQAHWHVLPTIAACQAGKDVYVEKPVGNLIHEGRAAIEAARKYDRIVQVGTQQHSWEHYRKAVDIIKSGRLGNICEVKAWDYYNRSPGRGNPPDCDPPAELDWDFYVGPSPTRAYNPNCYYNYGYDWYRLSGGGHTVAWGVHHFDIIHWAMGVKYPKAAAAMGGMYAFEDNRDWPETLDGIAEYGPGPIAKRGFVLQYTCRLGARRDFRAHAKCFIGTEGSMLLDRAGYTITAETRGGKKCIEEESFRTPADNAHQKVFLENMREHKRPETDIEVGHYATNVGHLMNISWLTGRKLNWDGEKEEVIGDAEANAVVNQPYRAPWKLEV